MSNYSGPASLYARSMSVMCALPGCERRAAYGYRTCGKHPPDELQAWSVKHEFRHPILPTLDNR